MPNTRTLILNHILPLVPFDGWTEHALRAAAKQAGLDAAAAKGAFPRGVKDCLDYFFTRSDEELKKAFPAEQVAKLKVPERIEALILYRLEHWLPHREAVRRAVARQALPWNMPHSSAGLYRLVDLMWRLSGDHSLDFSFYTKRATLAALY